MSCADVCLSMDHDSGWNDFFNARDVKARKPHVCCECAEPIAVGDTYCRESGKSDGDLFSMATCAPCKEIRDAFVCGGFTFTELWECIRSDMFPVWREKGAFDCLAKLTTQAAIDRCNRAYNQWMTDHEYDTPTPTGPHA